MPRRISGKKKQFIVIGLGSFGGSITRELYYLGCDVLAIDKDIEKVKKYMPYTIHAVQLDSTDEEALNSLGVSNFDHVVVAIGDNIQSSVLTTLILKELGTDKVWVKAENRHHQNVLTKIGADLVIHPESDMGLRVAHNMASEKIVDYINLSNEYSIVELVASKKIHNKSLLELDLRAKFGVTILAIKTKEGINVSPHPDEIIPEGSILVTMGSNQSIRKFEEKGI
ncbi:potassium channel family protein [Oceanobacillus iheyensis]|uniref:Hypothetical conserved protein n=1 Tax=Oceanobacillus iheyensis (strain DSM 14371 / CIP 107618 / JCM 11309 / KCTC 3954 / HTE831) TaxID=221109 RepID=Q8EQN2_OCEIH|nr:TrkA family potassium uptake protein [Oceanobacillus iheyensis]BAC13618.1 hypothetical conserved protein [Oceanobacillus iheyensis HTE831]